MVSKLLVPMEVNQFSSRTSRHVLSEPCPTEKKSSHEIFPIIQERIHALTRTTVLQALQQELAGPSFVGSRSCCHQAKIQIGKQASQRQVVLHGPALSKRLRSRFEILGKIELMKAEQSAFASYKHKAENQASDVMIL
ncbi:hypothetical protein CEXT_494891 [Caerostris extrusa]|uniref:Uncharacterized protein n=1 Tax=Caerostris extrusa TaxID=172846 RepID=A0AAV4XD51_CAEEX|nr:hypothetical protein CEXT_494891 [Caerostris extrusa]